MRATRSHAILATRFALAAVFLASGAAKLAGTDFSVESFARWGLPDWLRLLVGALEVIGAIGLARRPTAPSAAAGLALIMAGAVVTHLRAAGEAAMALLPAALAAALLVLRRTTRGQVA